MENKIYKIITSKGVDYVVSNQLSRVGTGVVSANFLGSGLACVGILPKGMELSTFLNYRNVLLEKFDKINEKLYKDHDSNTAKRQYIKTHSKWN